MFKFLTLDGPYHRYPRWEDRADLVIWVVCLAGIVADVIAEVLIEAKKPLTRDEIIAEVMKRRMVKKNTVLVGLSNRKRFAKVGKNQYQLIDA
jgi:hypothetical protein